MTEMQTIRTASGLIQVPADGIIHINPPSPRPTKTAPDRDRWVATPRMVGRVERIAMARFEARQLTTGDVERWDALEVQGRSVAKHPNQPLRLDSVADVIDPIAQTVRASTAIEGESVFAKDVPVALVEEPEERKKYSNDDYYLRVLGLRDLYHAYIWALTRPSPLEGGYIITPCFILELHRLSFYRFKPAVAGKWKEHDNEIAWANLTVRLLRKERVPEFMQSLCDRVNSTFKVAENTGSYSRFMAIAEFVLDFLAIHPFEDGNGRTARLLSTFLLERAGFRFARFYPVDAIIEERHKDYYNALLLSQINWYEESENISPWLEFYTDVIFTQWLRAHQEISRKRS